MQFAPKIIIALLIAAFFPACSTGGNSADSNLNASNTTADANNANSVKDNIDELEMTVKMPFHPEEAVWREDVAGRPANDRVPSPTDKKLTAVLLFKKDDAEKIVSQAAKHRPATPASFDTENWFPAELRAQSQISGNETIKGLSYAANDFLNPPYSDGKLTRIDGTDYFVLELFAK